MGVNWYVVRTKAFQEKKAAKAIEREGFQVYLPVKLVQITHARRREKVTRPLFPRYLFARFDPETQPFGKINRCRGVVDRGLMCDVDDVPLSVRDSVVDAILVKEALDLAKKGEVETGLIPGDIFVISVGEWASFKAKYKAEKKGKVEAEITLFGREVLVHLSYEQVSVCSRAVDSEAA